MSTFELSYFEMPGRAETAKLILLHAGVPYESKDVKWSEWEKVQTTVPFGQLPYMVEKKEDGKKFILGESHAIERYLARKYGYLGKDLEEAAFLESICDNGNAMSEKFFGRFALEGEAKEKAAENFLQVVVPKYIKYHEEILNKNGNNGFYLRDEFTLAEFLNAQMIRIINLLSGEEVFSASKSPALWKLVQNVRSHPSFTSYFKDTDAKLEEHSKSFFK
ncbi:thioredoxin-like protein [Basidiobolus meristosporus CBS 931.73]|uniref:Thioredoxin-like protein n=1 Tax=Basidiobolus meristosporus CBS 931.73 TaxID=1314790 RepID=A0A1Y1XZW1_9FUNG|nr:thioredoxin-like protein [Basidiobolus meristosporus CBS 931.73]|eukprot:ORX90904.1 thioredoxin-like protein [Basidiobolus meristosporus CBS 931.73]